MRLIASFSIFAVTGFLAATFSYTQIMAFHVHKHALRFWKRIECKIRSEISQATTFSYIKRGFHVQKHPLVKRIECKIRSEEEVSRARVLRPPHSPPNIAAFMFETRTLKNEDRKQIGQREVCSNHILRGFHVHIHAHLRRMECKASLSMIAVILVCHHILLQIVAFIIKETRTFEKKSNTN